MTQTNTLTYTPRSFILNGKPTLLLSGAIHYPRSTPHMWPKLMQLSKEAGLNTIETYIFWNLHERERGTYHFSGRLDIKRFLDLAREHDLHVILRFGPYICAETSYGGFPLWLRDIPGMHMRTKNAPFQQEIERWIRFIAGYLHEYSAAAGGPVIMAQIENEYNLVKHHYGVAGQEYLEWSYRLAQSLHWDIPWFMCHGGAKEALETINTFYGHTLYDEHHQRHPDQPALWTENWTGWYDIWNARHLIRTPENAAYAVARFFAVGGAGVNHYMWHGGTNFDHDGMFLQTTSYDYDAPINEFGFPTIKYHHFANLHHALAAIENVLLAQDDPVVRRPGPNQIIYTYGTGAQVVTFYCNDSAKQIHTMKINGSLMKIQSNSVIITQSGRILFDSARVPLELAPERTDTRVKTLQDWFVWNEPMPSKRTDGIISPTPIEQLSLTGDTSDYCWYTFDLDNTVDTPIHGPLVFSGFGDSCACYLDGSYVSSHISPMIEEQGILDESRVQAKITLTLPPGKHSISVFSISLGLIKGDWMIGHQNMVNERKGIWGHISYNNEPVPGPCTMHPGLRGESAHIWNIPCTDQQWDSYPVIESATKNPAIYQPELQKVVNPEEPIQPRWFQSAFQYTPSARPVFLSIPGPIKGMIWINDHCIGRMNAIPAQHINQAKPTEPLIAIATTLYLQCEYHIPLDWVHGGENIVTIFAENGHLVHAMEIHEWDYAKSG